MAFCLFLAYLAIALVRPIELFGLDLGGRPVFVLFGCALFLSIGAALGRRRLAARSVHLSLLAAFTAVIALSHLKAGWLGGALGSVAHFSTSVGLFVLVCLNATSWRRLQLTALASVACLLAVALLGVFSFHTGYYANELILNQRISYEAPADGFSAAEELDPTSRVVPAHDRSGLILWRIHGLGFINDPNDFAQAIVLVLPLLWSAVKHGAWLRNALFVWLPAAFLLYAVYLTHSRGALLGIASLFFFALKRRLGTLRISLGLGAAGALALVSGFGGGRNFSAGEESAGDRISAWFAGFQMLKSYPLLGAGYGNFTDHHHLTAHNSFVLCFAELGLIGYFFWLGLIVVAYRGLMQVMAAFDPQDRYHKLAELMRSSLIGFLTCAFFLSRAYQPMLYLALGLVVATWYCAMTSRSNGSTTKLVTPTWVPQTLQIGAGMIVVIYLAVFTSGGR